MLIVNGVQNPKRCWHRLVELQLWCENFGTLQLIQGFDAFSTTLIKQYPYYSRKRAKFYKNALGNLLNERWPPLPASANRAVMSKTRSRSATSRTRSVLSASKSNLINGNERKSASIGQISKKISASAAKRVKENKTEIEVPKKHRISSAQGNSLPARNEKKQEILDSLQYEERADEERKQRMYSTPSSEEDHGQDSEMPRPSEVVVSPELSAMYLTLKINTLYFISY